jgi:hypothetical protein
MTIYRFFIKIIKGKDILKVNIKTLIKITKGLNLSLKVRNT